MNDDRIDQLKRIYEDIKIAYIHEDSLTLDWYDLGVLLDILDKAKELTGE